MPIKTTHSIPRPMVLVTMAYLSGLIVGQWIPLPLAWGFLAAVLLLAGSAFQYWQSRKINGPTRLPALPLFLILAILGATQNAQLTRNDRQDALAAQRLSEYDAIGLTGTVAEEPRARRYSTQILLKDVSITAPEGNAPDRPIRSRIALIVKTAPAGEDESPPATLPLPGQTLRLQGHLQPLESARNPGSFDQKAYWRGRGVAALMTVSHPAALEVLAEPLSLKSRFYSTPRRMRQALGAQMDRQLTAGQAALARALLLGESWKLERHQSEPFAQTGLMHVLCVSGLHTGFILLLLMGIGRVGGLSPRGCALVGMIGLLGYACLTGLRPPVVRAMLTAELVLGGLILTRHISPLASFATAAFVTLVADPRNLMRLDWQLSYLCVGAILILTPQIYELLTRRLIDPMLRTNERPISLWTYWTRHLIVIPFATSLAIQLGVVPFQILKFGQVNPLLVVNNLLGGYLTMLSVFSLAISALACGAQALLAWIGGPLATLGEALVWLSFRPSQAMLWLLSESVGKLARYGAAPIHPGMLPLWFMAAYYFTLSGGLWLRVGRAYYWMMDRRQRTAAIFSILACLALLAWYPLLPHGGRNLDLYMMDVGQGDAMVVRFPGEKFMVVDAGDRRPIDHGAWTLAPFLKSLGAERIDCLVATHGDADHIGGMTSLLEQIPVDLLLYGAGTDRSTSINDDLNRTIEAMNIPSYRPQSGETLRGFEPTRVRVLGPLPSSTGNNGSVVLEIGYGEVEMLLTGDLELKGEQSLIERGLTGDIEILKVGHHGSLSSTSGPFLAACRPELALTSVGRANRYGHPSRVVLDRLQRMGVQNLRTDQLGALWIRTDGHRIEAFRYVGP